MHKGTGSIGLLSRVTVAAAVLLSILLASGSQYGLVKAEALRLRAEPNLASPILALITQDAPMPEPSEMADSWYAILIRDQQSFLNSYYQELAKNQLKPTDKPLLAYVNTGSSVLNLRSGPGTAYSIVDQVSSGTLLTVLSEGDGWYQVQHESGSAFLYGEYVLLMTQEEYAAYQKSAEYKGQQIAQFARNYLGCSYVYGGNGPSSFDCSGFTKYIYGQFGYSLNRTATDQLANGASIEKSGLKAGDLVFFRSSGTVKPVSHVGLYIGDGSFIHASTNQYEVRIDQLNSGYYSSIFVGARRVV